MALFNKGPYVSKRSRKAKEIMKKQYKLSIFGPLLLLLSVSSIHGMASWFSGSLAPCRARLMQYGDPFKKWALSGAHCLTNRYPALNNRYVQWGIGLTAATAAVGCGYKVYQYCKRPVAPVPCTKAIFTQPGCGDGRESVLPHLQGKKDAVFKSDPDGGSDSKRNAAQQFSWKPTFSHNGLTQLMESHNLDERHIMESWPESLRCMLTEYQVDDKLKSQLDHIMINDGLLKSLSLIYINRMRTDTIDILKNQYGVTFLKVVKEKEECASAQWRVFKLQKFPDLVFKIALAGGDRHTELSNFERVYKAHIVREKFNQSELCKEYDLVLPEERFYICPLIGDIAYRNVPKVIVVSKGIDVSGARKLVGDGEDGALVEKMVQEVIDNWDYAQDSDSHPGNIFIKGSEIIILDTKAVNAEMLQRECSWSSISTAATQKLPNLVPDTFMTQFGLMAHKKKSSS